MAFGMRVPGGPRASPSRLHGYELRLFHLLLKTATMHSESTYTWNTWSHRRQAWTETPEDSIVSQTRNRPSSWMASGRPGLPTDRPPAPGSGPQGSLLRNDEGSLWFAISMIKPDFKTLKLGLTGVTNTEKWS